MDTNETRQRAIGLLTAAYTAYHEGSNRQGLARMADTLLADFISTSVKLKLTDTKDIKAVAQAISDQVTKELEPAITTILATLIAAFIVLSREYEAACPDADVPRILQDFAIRGQGLRLIE
jgi:hypothetical protein